MHLSRIIKDKETEEGADPPRLMALDDYFQSDGQVKEELLKNKEPEPLPLSLESLSLSFNNLFRF